MGRHEAHGGPWREAFGTTRPACHPAGSLAAGPMQATAPSFGRKDSRPREQREKSAPPPHLGLAAFLPAFPGTVMDERIVGLDGYFLIGLGRDSVRCAIGL